AGAGKTKLVKDAGRSQCLTALASPRTQIQRRYCASSARAEVVESAIYARPSSRATRVEYPASARRRSASGAGHSAISPPAATISAPSQIHVTSGETIIRNVAG